MIKCLTHPLLWLLVLVCGTPSASPESAPGTGAFLHRVGPQLFPRVEAEPASPPRCLCSWSCWGSRPPHILSSAGLLLLVQRCYTLQGPSLKKARNLVSGVWKRTPLSCSAFLMGIYSFVLFCTSVIQNTPASFWTRSSFFQAAWRIFSFTENWRKRTTMDCGGALGGGFGAMVCTLYPQVMAEVVPHICLDEVFNKCHYRRTLCDINPDIITPRAPLHIGHFFL